VVNSGLYPNSRINTEPKWFCGMDAFMSVELGHSQALRLLHDVALQQVRDGGHDLSNRQLAILLTIYLEVPPHTVRGLALKLEVTKPVITRALDAMGEMDLVARRRDPADRRNVIVQRTVQGALFLEKLGDIVINKARQLS
jgi:DNA-binding MarR family transcriptional regulator